MPHPKTFVVNPEALTILATVETEEVPTEASLEYAQSLGMEQKTELHLTVIGFQTGLALKTLFADLPEEQAKAKFLELIELTKTINWSFDLVPKLFHISKDHEDEHRESIIRPVDLPGLNEFYQTMNKLLGTNLATPYPHITLFTKSSDPERMLRGIGVYSFGDLELLNLVDVTT